MSNFCGQKSAISFKRIDFKDISSLYSNIFYLKELYNLYLKYIDNLEDDFSPLRKSFEEFCGFIDKISPYFYIIFIKDEFCGFIFLENIVGKIKYIHSAEVTICIKRKFWGNNALKIAEIFKSYCFNFLKITKLKALIYPQNKTVKRLLRECGFKKEAVLKSETLRKEKLQDIEIYTLLNTVKGGCNAV